MKPLDKFREAIYHQHDVVCNQKYSNDLPYSMHLKFVESQAKLFINKIYLDVYPFDFIKTPKEDTVANLTNIDIILAAAIAHDVIEDARFTYNDLKTLALDCFNQKPASHIADIVFAVTDEKGKNRAERKPERYYELLKNTPYALYVKLADLSANTLYSKLTGSSMYTKYKEEFPAFKEKTYDNQYGYFFNYLENI